MKILIVVASVLAVAVSHPIVKTWTLNELSTVIEKSEGEPEMRKYYIDALNTIMYGLYTGSYQVSVLANVLSPSGNRKWTKTELEIELRNKNIDQSLRASYASSYHHLMNGLKPEGNGNETEVVIPALDISTWSITDLADAMENPDTKVGLKPYLEKAKKEIKTDTDKGLVKEHVTMVTPVGLVPVKNTHVPIIVPRTL